MVILPQVTPAQLPMRGGLGRRRVTFLQGQRRRDREASTPSHRSVPISPAKAMRLRTLSIGPSTSRYDSQPARNANPI